MDQVKLTRKRLLFVDDEPAIRKTLPVILGRYGFAVTVAATVAEAIDEIKTKEFDLLLSDLNIDREGDGYEVILAMREVDPDCVSIVLTGHPDVESAVEGLHLGVDDYIMKPAKTDVLVALLAEKLAARKAKARILSVSYDQTLLRMRHMLFEAQGYEVVSTNELASSLEHCKQGGFDLFVLGHSIPDEDKQTFVEAFRKVSPAPIISLRRTVGDQKVDGADYHVETDPEPLLKLVADVLRKKSVAHQ